MRTVTDLQGTYLTSGFQEWRKQYCHQNNDTEALHRHVANPNPHYTMSNF